MSQIVPIFLAELQLPYQIWLAVVRCPPIVTSRYTSTALLFLSSLLVKFRHFNLRFCFLKIHCRYCEIQLVAESVVVLLPWRWGSTLATMHLPISLPCGVRCRNSRLSSSPSHRHNIIPATESKPPSAATQIALPKP